VLGEVGVIAAEDTRTTRKLLTRHGIQGKLVSYHKFSGEGRLHALTEVLATQDVALVTDAGMPAVSDPGYELVLSAVRAGVTVVPIPGASAPVAALAASGLPTEQVLFTGFLPRKPADLRRTLAGLQAETRTMVCFEAPHRLRKTLATMAEALPDRPIAVCRELTKLHEEIYRGSAVTALEHFSTPRGEITMVIGGAGLSADSYWQAEVPATTEAAQPPGRYRRPKTPRTTAGA
jgi:16S rRNA (cytidine1402-2'-O)-methyltransferase